MLADVADASKQVRFGVDGVGVLEVVMCTELVPNLPIQTFPTSGARLSPLSDLPFTVGPAGVLLPPRRSVTWNSMPNQLLCFSELS